MQFKSETTVRRYMRELQTVIDGDDLIASRLAYFALHAIRRVVEDVKDWPPLAEDAYDTAKLIQRELYKQNNAAINKLRSQKIA